MVSHLAKFRRTAHRPHGRGRQLPLVDEFVGDGVTRLAFHDVRLCLLVSQRDSGHLEDRQTAGKLKQVPSGASDHMPEKERAGGLQNGATNVGDYLRTGAVRPGKLLDAGRRLA